MAGVKGRSGGARPNTGGARPGAGRKPKERQPIKADGDSSLDILRAVMRDERADPTLRVRAAIAVAQYEHVKLHDGGKKEAKADEAEKASTGKFAPKLAPKLVVNNA